MNGFFEIICSSNYFSLNCMISEKQIIRLDKHSQADISETQSCEQDKTSQNVTEIMTRSKKMGMLVRSMKMAVSIPKTLIEIDGSNFGDSKSNEIGSFLLDFSSVFFLNFIIFS